MTDNTDAVVPEETAEAVEAEVEAVEAEDSPGEQDAEPEASSAEKETKGVQKRIDELTREKHEARREAEFLRQEIERLSNQAPKEAKEPEASKTLADFDYDDAKFAAYVEERAAARAKAEYQRESAASKEAERQRRALSDFRSRESEYAAEHADYYDLAHRNPNVSQAMADVIREMETGPEVAYYLAKNSAISGKLANLPLAAVARELGRIEERLAVQKTLKGKSVSDAPAPALKLKTSNPAIDKSPDQMTDLEFARWRRKQIAKR